MTMSSAVVVLSDCSFLVSCPDRTLYAREGLVHEVQILGSDGKFSHYEYHYPIHGRSGKV